METKESLAKKKCIACEGNTKPLEDELVIELMKAIPDWELDNQKIKRIFSFKDFKESVSFVNKVADIANEEDHHPIIWIDYSRVKIILWTHAIDGLHENDFIMASKIDFIN